MNLNNFKSFAKTKVKQVTFVNANVWLYTRVSSKDQEMNRSLESQKEEGLRFAQRNNYEVTQIFGGTFESASGDFTRKEFTKLLDAIKRSRKRPYAVMIYTMSRFSRSGGGGVTLAHQLIDEMGVHLIEVSTGKNTTTPEGKLEIFSSLIRASQDNIDRLKVTIPGMRKLLEKGSCLGRAPMGYLLYGPRVKNPEYFRPKQEIKKSSVAPAIRLAWELKLNGASDHIIKERLGEMNINVSMQMLSKMWRNPFYCGVSTNKLLEDNLVKGNWEPFVTEEEFFQVQNILKGKRYGYKPDIAAVDRPLTGYLHCAKCGTKMKSYAIKAKGIHYYACRVCKDATINADLTGKSKGLGVHDLFRNLLDCFTLKHEFADLYKKQLQLTFESANKENYNTNVFFESELSKLKENMKNLKRRYALEGLDKDIYLEFKKELDDKIVAIETKMNGSSLQSSNQEKYIELSVRISKNISKYWESGSIEVKQRIQKMVFPDSIFVDTKNRVVLTKKVNAVFALVAHLAKVAGTKNEEGHDFYSWPSPSVAGE